MFVNACVRANSRTRLLADHLLTLLGGSVTERRLSETAFPAADEDFLNTRDALICRGEFDHPLFGMAREFASADTIVIAAPYWDLSFPAALKQYFEQISVMGITFRYTREGAPIGLCRAKRLYYVTSAGGVFTPTDYGFGYVRELARSFYGIADVRLIKAEGLDIDGADEAGIIRACKKRIEEML